MSTVTIINNPVLQRVSITADSITSVVEITPNYTTRMVSIIVRAPGLGANDDRVLTADGPTEDGDGMPTYNPASGQNIIYLPSETLRYRLSSLSGPLFPGIHYTRSGNQITLLTGDISADDKFLLCEY